MNKSSKKSQRKSKLDAKRGLRPSTVYPLLSQDMQLAIDIMATTLPEDEGDNFLFCSARTTM